MKITCNIVRDLLPLYAEDMISQDSKELVDDHLCQCDACMKELAELKKAPRMPLEVETGSLKRVGDTIRRRRILAVLAAGFLAAALVMGVALFLGARVYLTAEQAVLDCRNTESGDILIQYSSLVTGCSSRGTDENCGVIASTSVGKLLFAQKDREKVGTEFQINAMSDTQNIWYIDPHTGKCDTLLWDAGNAYDGAADAEVNYHLAYYFAGVLVLGAVLLLPARVFRGTWYGELCFRVGALAGCNGLSLLIVTAGQFMELWGEFTEGFHKSLCLTVPMALSVLFFRQIHRLKKQNQG